MNEKTTAEIKAEFEDRYGQKLVAEGIDYLVDAETVLVDIGGTIENLNWILEILGDIFPSVDFDDTDIVVAHRYPGAFAALQIFHDIG